MGATPGLVAIARRIKPELATLVPERRQELTTEGGLDVVKLKPKIRGAVSRLHERGVAVSLFIDPTMAQVEASKDVGADMIEIHTGEYANARTQTSASSHLRQISKIAAAGRSLGLGVNAGHGLDYKNIEAFCAIREVEEVSIGHAIIVRAVDVGLGAAVKEMVELIARGVERNGKK